LLAKLRALHNW